MGLNSSEDYWNESCGVPERIVAIWWGADVAWLVQEDLDEGRVPVDRLHDKLSEIFEELVDVAGHLGVILRCRQVFGPELFENFRLDQSLWEGGTPDGCMSLPCTDRAKRPHQRLHDLAFVLRAQFKGACPFASVSVRGSSRATEEKLISAEDVDPLQDFVSEEGECLELILQVYIFEDYVE